MPIELFPNTMPTMCDIQNQIVYAFDWMKYKMLKYSNNKWSQIASFKGY